MKTETNNNASYVKVCRASMRGWNYFPAYAHIRLLGCYVNASLKATDKAWCASAQWYGVEYRAEGRRQMDAAIALANLIIKSQNA